MAHPDDLLAHAKPIFDLSPIGPIEAMTESLFDDPLWLSENVLLAHSASGDGFFDTPYRFDLKHNRLTPLTRLNALIGASRPADWLLSSDHRWILWRETVWCEGRNEAHFDFVAARINGRRSVRWTVDGDHCNGPFFWQPGTHYWVHLMQSGGALSEAQFFDLGHPHRKRVIPLPPIEQTDLLGVRPDGSVLLTEEYYESSYDSRKEKLRLTELRFVRGRAVTRTWAICVPSTGENAQISLSPDGKRLAWLIRQGATPEQAKNPQQAVLYVSGVDGTDSRWVGTIRFRTDHEQYYTFLPGWYPDSKRLLLRFRDRLYGVSAL
jgi:hypothetical protein